jgi:hypothetical protein
MNSILKQSSIKTPSPEAFVLSELN